MNNKGQNMLMGVFITIILLVIIGSISMSFIQTNQEITDIVDDSFTGSNTTCTQITDNCINTLTSVDNGTTTLTSTNYTACESTSASSDTDGILILEDSYDGATLNATYKEESCSRVKGIGGTVLSYASVVLALAIFAFLAGFAIKRS